VANPDDMERVLARHLRQLDDAGRLRVARETVDHLGDSFAHDVCALLLEGLEGVDDGAIRTWLETLPDNANGVWLRTQLLTDPIALAQTWERFFSFRVARQPADLLSWARALCASGAREPAMRQLRRALGPGAEYSLFARAEKLVRDLTKQPTSCLRHCRFAVLGSSTTSFLVPVLQALCLRDQIDADIYEGPYGSMEQEIRDPDSGLAKFRPDIVVLVMHWRDLHLDSLTADPQDWIDRFVEQRKLHWQRLAEAFGCHIVQPSFDYPATDAYGNLSGILPGGRTSMIDRLNLRLREEAGSTSVSILDMVRVQREVGTFRWEDNKAWYRYRQHPALEALPALAEACMSHVRPVLGLSRKVLVTDLDNTLWQGVIGEDGLDGIGIGPGTPEGEAYLQLQRYLLELKRRGILLAVCSKNNPEDALLPFLHHPQMALKRDDFAAFRVNWDNKVDNLQALARELSLGIDSLVFLDDNSFEREWVRSQLPEVAVVELGSSPLDFERQLDRGRYFEALTLSGEDLARAEQYRKQARREQLRVSSASLDEFLRDLRLEASVAGVSEKNLARVTQLINKTNQFNVTTHRYKEAQVLALAQDPLGWTAAFQLSDRMDSYGLIGVLLCRAISRDAWEVDTWLMSCRALGRQMEKFMFDRMIEAAIARGVKRIVGVYRSTAKNDLVEELYDQVGFRRVSEAQDEVRYELKVPETLIVSATHIRNVTAHLQVASTHAGQPPHRAADDFTQRIPDEHQPSG
jgi:FkbH-like protein